MRIWCKYLRKGDPLSWWWWWRRWRWCNLSLRRSLHSRVFIHHFDIWACSKPKSCFGWTEKCIHIYRRKCLMHYGWVDGSVPAGVNGDDFMHARWTAGLIADYHRKSMTADWTGLAQWLQAKVYVLLIRAFIEVDQLPDAFPIYIQMINELFILYCGLDETDQTVSSH